MSQGVRPRFLRCGPSASASAGSPFTGLSAFALHRHLLRITRHLGHVPGQGTRGNECLFPTFRPNQLKRKSPLADCPLEGATGVESEQRSRLFHGDQRAVALEKLLER